MYPYTEEEFEQYLMGEQVDEQRPNKKGYDYDAWEDDSIRQAVDSRFEDDNATES